MAPAQDPPPDGSPAACPEPAGLWGPLIDRGRCEGKGDCERVCPEAVFELRRLDEVEKAGMSWWSKVRLAVHGSVQAVAVRVDACRACGLCVAACPERALTLARREQEPEPATAPTPPAPAPPPP